MLLSARLLENVSSANAFDLVAQTRITEGDQVTIYLQLIDISKNRVEEGFVPPGRRYMPAAGATLQVTIDNINNAKKLVKTASQPVSQDPSIWAFTVLSTDAVAGTVNLRLLLNESGRISHGLVKAAISVESATGL